LPTAPESSEENEHIASIRWDAMNLKTRYLAGEDVEKSAFREGYVDTEDYFDTAPVCAIDDTSREYLRTFDIQDWYRRKRENWEILREIKKDGVKVLKPEDYGCYPFSLILQFDDINKRDIVRKALIEKCIYPAILWSVPLTGDGERFVFSRTMLSIHCDARYSQEDILTMKSIIESIL
jgi:hypothetical protein